MTLSEHCRKRVPTTKEENSEPSQHREEQVRKPAADGNESNVASYKFDWYDAQVTDTSWPCRSKKSLPKKNSPNKREEKKEKKKSKPEIEPSKRRITHF